MKNDQLFPSMLVASPGSQGFGARQNIEGNVCGGDGGCLVEETVVAWALKAHGDVKCTSTTWF